MSPCALRVPAVGFGGSVVCKCSLPSLWLPSAGWFRTRARSAMASASTLATSRRATARAGFAARERAASVAPSSRHAMAFRWAARASSKTRAFPSLALESSPLHSTRRGFASAAAHAGHQCLAYANHAPETFAFACLPLSLADAARAPCLPLPPRQSLSRARRTRRLP
jgi:hypothetical protein